MRGQQMKSRIISIITGVIVGCLCGILSVTLINTASNRIDDSKVTTKAIMKSENNKNSSTSENIPAAAEVNSSLTTADSSSVKEDSSLNNSKLEESSSINSEPEESSIPDKNVSKIGTTKNTGKKVVYLTFDDGPSKLTPKVLEILDKYKVKATFFVTGFDKSSAEYIKIAHDKGHTIGLHTYSHDYSKVYASVDDYYKDLNKIGELCKKQIGFVPHYIRFPGGSSNTVSRKYSKGIMSYLSKDVLKKGYQYYDWNSANGDAEGGSPSASQLYNNAIQYVGGTDLVMLCHDSGNKNSTVQSLPKIIEYYQSQGYSFKAIDDTTYVSHHQANN